MNKNSSKKKINSCTEDSEEQNPEFKIETFNEKLQSKPICMQPIQCHC